MVIEEVVIEELQDILSELYFKYGKENEIIRLSRIMDILIVSKQRKLLIKGRDN